MASRHFFAGVNTPYGFYSYFDHIASDREAQRKIYIKGAPGTGKSTLMKRIEKRAEEEGYKCDVFHCSSDPHSYDGIYIKKLGVSVTDATSPHICEPKYAGLSGEYFDSAKFLRSSLLSEHREDIIHFADHKMRAYEKAYNYLASAQKVVYDISLMYKKNMYLHGIEIETQKLAGKILPEITMPKSGKCRKMFLSAVGPDGFVNYIKEAFCFGRTFVIKGGYGADLLIKKIMETALWRGFSVEAFYCPMFPGEKVEHLIIPDINVNITTYNFYHHYGDGEVIDLDEYITQMPVNTEEAWGCTAVLFRQAIAALADARAAHSFLEGYYVPVMDFDAFEEDAEKLIKSIFD